MMKMPNWLNKTSFSPKKTPIRKAPVSLAAKDLSPKRIEKELGPNVGEIRICLGDQQAVFDGGLWVPESGKVGGTFKENEKLKREVRKLEEENNLLKVKFELLLDMLTQATAESNLYKEELESIRSKSYNSKRPTT
ncbi:hypothetical protein QAD02_015074 [Eretmocerus hayati]|uniref:Uncharacterized protein n=1 Tax=Eretmocerus hayati TaxID=131215 RepID=A0ACC2PA08_9HYME|nr:hypothetical protein QAD02_015074 [Eretmocerus hayati]